MNQNLKNQSFGQYWRDLRIAFFSNLIGSLATLFAIGLIQGNTGTAIDLVLSIAGLLFALGSSVIVPVTLMFVGRLDVGVSGQQLLGAASLYGAVQAVYSGLLCLCAGLAHLL